MKALSRIVYRYYYYFTLPVRQGRFAMRSVD